MQRIGRNIGRWLALTATALLVACGGGGGGAGSAPTYTVGGTVSGLVGSGLVLQVNGAGNLSIPANGTYAFPGVVTGTAYAVTVLTQPTTPAQSCVVANGTGSVAGADVTNITVTCTTLPTFSVGGTVTGLAGTGLSLRNNGTNTLALSADGAFVFSTELLNSATYAVTIATQPSAPAQSCTVANGTGTIASLDVSNVAITCVTLPTFAVGGSVTGLLGSGLVLRNNGADNLSIAADGTFTFSTPVAQSGTYSVTVATQPSIPAQACSVSAGTGTVASAAVTNVSVNCQLPTTRFVYVTTSSSTSPTLNQLSAYSVHPTTGSLTFAQSVASGTTPVSVSVDPSARFAYVVAQQQGSTNGAVSVFSINPTTGVLGNVGSLPAGPRSQSIAIDPLGRFAFVTNSSGPTVSAFRIASGSGALAAVGAISTGTLTNPIAVATDVRGRAVYVANSATNEVQRYTITSPSGSLTFAATVPTGTLPISISVDPLGRFAYVANVTSNTVNAYLVDSVTGALTEIDQNAGAPGTAISTGASTSPSSIVIDPLGKFAYVVLNSNVVGATGVAAFSIHPSTGILTSLGITPAGNLPITATVDTSGRFLYVVNAGGTVSAFSIDSATGALTSIGGQLSVGTNPTSIAVGRTP